MNNDSSFLCVSVIAEVRKRKREREKERERERERERAHLIKDTSRRDAATVFFCTILETKGRISRADGTHKQRKIQKIEVYVAD